MQPSAPVLGACFGLDQRPLKISGWAADYSGCGYYRIVLPLQALRERGHEVSIGVDIYRPEDPAAAIRHQMTDTLGTEYVGPAARDREVDVLIGQRVHLPAPSGLWQAIGNQRPRPWLVYETDDDLYNVDPSNPVHPHFSQPHIQANIRRNVELADLVTVSTEPLARIMRQHNDNVMVIPNAVPGWLLREPSRARTDGVVTIGWAGSSTHEMDWALVRRQVTWYVRQRLGVELHLIGHDYGSAMKLPEGRYRFSGWRKTVPAYYRLVDFHIGLAPLRGHPFNESKSAIKAIEYAAMGIPIIASKAGPYAGYVQHGVTGFLVDNDQPKQWVEYLDALVRDPDLRAQMGAAAREQAEARTIERIAPRWEAALTTR